MDDPIYCILNMCRVYWFLLEDVISSKQEAGHWAIGILPDKLRALVSKASDIYSGSKAEEPFDDKELKRFAEYMDDKVQTLLKADGCSQEDERGA